MSLRILHCISSVNPEIGGPIEGLKQLAAANRAIGNHVEVVSLDGPTDPWVSSFPIECHPMGPAIGNYRYSQRLAPWLRRHAAEYDAVIVNGIWQYNSFAAWRALAGGTTPYFVFTHGMLDPWFKRQFPLKHLKKSLYWPWAEYRVLRDAAAVLFTSESERLLARESFALYRCNERVVNYGTNLPPDDSDAQRSAFLEKFPQLKDKRCLLFLGRMHTKKGPDLLLKAWAAVLSELPEHARQSLHLVMAGPAGDAYGAQLHELAQRLGLDNTVTWTGMLGGALKWGAFRCADAFVLPSHQENFGIAVAEALSCGTPVLISREVNIWREIDADGAGLVDDDTIEGTERLLRRWLATEESVWSGMRLAASQCFDRRFLATRAVESLVATIEEFGRAR